MFPTIGFLKENLIADPFIGLKTELVLSIMAMSKNETIKRLISHYFTQLRYITPSIKGKDLMALGYSPGPMFREILTAVHNEKLNGKLTTKSEELEFARNYTIK